MNDLPAIQTAEDEAVEIGELDASLGFLLRLAQVQIFEDFFNQLSVYGLKPGEFSVLWVVSLNPGQRQGAIARRLRIKPAHMTKLIQRLETAGLMQRTIPDDDRRSVLLRLTDQGQAFVSRRRSEFFGYFHRDQERLSDAELRQLVGLLQKFVWGAEAGS